MERNYLPLPLQMGAALGHVDIAICLRFILLTLAVKLLLAAKSLRLSSALPELNLRWKCRMQRRRPKARPLPLKIYIVFYRIEQHEAFVRIRWLKRVARDVTPLLQDYLAQHPATTQDEEASDPEEASSP
jgi:hypothetical protein